MGKEQALARVAVVNCKAEQFATTVNFTLNGLLTECESFVRWSKKFDSSKHEVRQIG